MEQIDAKYIRNIGIFAHVVQAERARRGVNPLDQSKYILSVRKALLGS
ncbi:hypothetical protein L1N85_06785 [Paenibacillus alkaliterrae]|nr:hypothetical protein [Paenibacillus alkaliterrae]MCF2938138.1 hypothetical protein [Paenibacillus alkaliterrae]